MTKTKEKLTRTQKRYYQWLQEDLLLHTGYQWMKIRRGDYMANLNLLSDEDIEWLMKK